MLPDLTPLMRQYRQVKQRYPDAILFFRVGDFYEMFHEDAIEGSRLLEIALTSRDKHKADHVPLCGVPYHAATNYIAKLLRAGRSVAVCDQTEDPQTAKGLVRREVVRVYTPGTLIEPDLLAAGEPNYLAAIAPGSSGAGLAWLDELLPPASRHGTRWHAAQHLWKAQSPARTLGRNHCLGNWVGVLPWTRLRAAGPMGVQLRHHLGGVRVSTQRQLSSAVISG